MASHKAFETAGKKPGLQIWRVEKMDLAPVPTDLHGDFFTGDAYIVLHTTCGFSYNIHTWAGKKASQDETAASAILMTQMDDFLGGRPVQFTEFQDEESNTFMSYFRSGIKYKAGGVASGFKHVVTNEANVQRLLHVKGRRLVRAKEVELCWSSFNKGDCFIIDLGKSIYHWSGSDCNYRERLKASELAIAIRDNERRGRAEIHMIDEGEEPKSLVDVLGPKPDDLPGSSNDEAVSKQSRHEATMYMISDAASLEPVLVGEKNPFRQDMLSQDECYILDNHRNNKIFVWKGKSASTEERKKALTAAKKFIKDHKYPENTQVQVLPAGSETTLFKQFFFNWLDKDETTGLGQTAATGNIAKVLQIPFDASSLHHNQAMAAQHCMVDNGSGNIQIWRVEGNDKVSVDPSTYGQFYGGDCYLVLYSYDVGGRQKYVIYTWQGRKCTKDELAGSAFLTVNLDDSMGGVATQVRVTQGQEPAHLVSIFKDKPLVIHLGGTSRYGGQSEVGSTRLFHIRRSSTNATRAVEVEPTATSLNTNDVFMLKTEKSLFQWEGLGASVEEKKAAEHLVDLLWKGSRATIVVENMETAHFWKELGGKKDYQTSRTLQATVKSPRLFECSNKIGRLIAEEVPADFTQLDLITDDVMILDTWDQIFVWVGKNANEVEKSGSYKIAEDYVNSDPSGRRGIPVVIIKQGEEPLSFTGWFHAWDPKMWEKDRFEQLRSQFKK